MNTIDIILGIFLLVFFVNGLRKGIIRTVIGLAGLLAIFVLIANYGNTAKLLVLENLNVPDLAATIIAYILIAIVIALIFRIVIFILHRMLDVFSLGALNRFLGGIFNLVCGAAIIAILLMIADISPYYKEIRNFTSRSYIVNHIRVASNKIQKDYPKLAKPNLKSKKVKSQMEELKEKLEEEITKPKQQMEEFIEEKTK